MTLIRVMTVLLRKTNVLVIGNNLLNSFLILRYYDEDNDCVQKNLKSDVGLAVL